MESGRDALIDMLSKYKKMKSHRITVVFDGGGAPDFSERMYRRKGIEIRFSRGGYTADYDIKKMAARERERALVVSSDRDIADFAASCNAAVISSPEFKMKMMLSDFSGDFDLDEEEDTGWIPTTKKKGPRRRLSKKKRRNKSKIRKL